MNIMNRFLNGPLPVLILAALMTACISWGLR
nr:MAG TPA: hypothetical protein [Caudoviricetes sp.]